MALGRRRWQRSFLRACLSGSSAEPARELAEMAPDAWLQTVPVLASFHRVVGQVLERAGDVVAPPIRVALLRLQRDEHARRLIAAANVRRCDELLRRLGVPYLVVKGPVLAALYDVPRLRSYRDLDLVVPRREFGRVLEAFEADGATVVEANWPYFLEQLAGQVDLSTNVDLHWHFLYFEHLRRSAPLRMEDVFDRARTVEVNGTAVRTTDPVDTLIHLALHACLAGGARLIWMKDLEQAVLNDCPSWAAVVDRAHAWRVNLHVGQMLLRSRQLLSTPVPDEVLQALIPAPAWRATVHALDRLFPITAWTRHDTPATLLAEHLQSDVSGTLSFLAAAPARRLRSRASRQDARSDAHARAAYLRLVEEGG